MKQLFTRNELMYIKVTLFAFREIQKRVGVDKQDKEFSGIINKITDEVNRIDGKTQDGYGLTEDFIAMMDKGVIEMQLKEIDKLKRELKECKDSEENRDWKE